MDVASRVQYYPSRKGLYPAGGLAEIYRAVRDARRDTRTEVRLMASKKPLVEGAEEGLRQLKEGLHRLASGGESTISKFRRLAENWARKRLGGT
jgi:hypothetical protein